MPASLLPFIQAHLKSMNSLLGFLVQIPICFIPGNWTQFYTHNDQKDEFYLFLLLCYLCLI